MGAADQAAHTVTGPVMLRQKVVAQVLSTDRFPTGPEKEGPMLSLSPKDPLLA